jgi:hypothetical protein
MGKKKAGLTRRMLVNQKNQGKAVPTVELTELNSRWQIQPISLFSFIDIP